MTLRIVLADDHALIREALKVLLARERDFEVVGLAEDGAEALRLVRQLAPDVLVTDISMAGLNGIDAIRRACAHQATLRVICLTMHGNQRHVLAALDAGASGYVLKEASYEELAQAVRAVAAGRIHLSPTLVGLMVDEIRLRRHAPASLKAASSAATLTPREREIVQLYAEDLSTQDIADRLHLSARTVSTHRENVTRKLGVHGIAGLTRYAMQEGLSTLETLPPT